MKKITVLKSNGQLIHEGEFAGQEWLDQNLATNAWGKPDRWLTSTDGTHTESREVLISEEVPEHTAMQMQYDYTDEMNPVEIGEIEVTIPFQEAVYQTEYFFPAEYSYEIVEESLDAIKAKKLAEISALSISQNDELRKWNEYRSANILAGIYDEAKLESYKSAYLAKSETLRNEYYRCSALVEFATTEEEVLAIQFTLE